MSRTRQITERHHRPRRQWGRLPRILLGVFFALLLLVSLLLYPRLPNELPMQFSLSGEVNRTMNKEFAIWCIPVLEAVILLYTDCRDNRIAGLAIAILLTIIQLGIMLLFMR